MSEALTFSKADFLRILNTLQNMNLQGIYLHHPSFGGMSAPALEPLKVPAPVTVEIAKPFEPRTIKKRKSFEDDELREIAEAYARGEDRYDIGHKYGVSQGSFYAVLDRARVKFGDTICPRRPHGGPRRGRSKHFFGSSTHAPKTTGPELQHKPRPAKKKEIINYARANGVMLAEIEGDIRLNGRALTDAELLRITNEFRLKATLPPFSLCEAA